MQSTQRENELAASRELAAKVFTIGKKYTTVRITASFAMTVVDRFMAKPTVNGETFLLLKGKRNKGMFATSMMKFGHDLYSTLIVEGWDHPVLDAQSAPKQGNVPGITVTVMHGNACMNIVGTVDQVREFSALNINPHFKRGYLLAQDPMDGKRLTVCFPEEAAEMGHAVLKRLLAEAK